jgi:glycosyltransferase involved in cell wall biosynthesis
MNVGQDVGRLSVVQMSFSGSFGGRENVAFSLSKILSERIHSSLLYLILEMRAGEEGQKKLLARLDDFDIRYRIFYTGSRFSKQLLQEIATALRHDMVQIAHCHCYKSAVYISLVRSFCNLNVKTVFTLHGLQIPLSLNSLFIHVMNHVALLSVDSIIGCSSEIVQRYRMIPFLRKKITVIQNCLLAYSNRALNKVIAKKQIADRYDLDLSALWIGNVGRLTKQKNFPLFLQAIARIKNETNRGQKIQYLIAGNGELKEELIAQTKNLGIDNDVFFLGFVSNMDEFYIALDILSLTSDWEGTPMCILEGMQHRLPIIASAVGGTVDLLKHDQSGILFKKGNIDEFVKALKLLINDRDIRKRFGQNAFVRVRDVFTPAMWRDRHIKHYKDLVCQKGH